MNINVSRWNRTVALLLGILSFSTFTHAEESAEAQEKLRYPMEVINRPGVLPTGIYSIKTALDVVNNTGKDNTKSKDLELSVSSEMGLAKGWLGKFSYDGVALHNFNAPYAKRTVKIGVKRDLYANSFMSKAFEVSLPIHIWDKEIVRDVTFGVPVTFFNSKMAGGILSDVFTLTMRENMAFKFTFDFWYGIQVADRVWTSIESSVGNINIINEAKQASLETSWIWQKPKATLGVTYVLNPHIDLQANFGCDNARDFANSVKGGIAVTWRGGKLFG